MKGNPEVLQYLQKAINGEFAAQHQYTLHGRMLENWGIKKLAAHWMDEVADETAHMRRFMDRMLFLESIPQVQTIDTVRIGGSVEAILNADLAAEMSAVALYTEAAAFCHEAGDYVTRGIFEATLADEQAHVNFIETQLSLIGTVGVELYIQKHIGKP